MFIFPEWISIDAWMNVWIAQYQGICFDKYYFSYHFHYLVVTLANFESENIYLFGASLSRSTDAGQQNQSQVKTLQYKHND